MEDTITISRYRYLQLQKDSAQLRVLQENGVDNWDGYGNFSDDVEWSSVDKELNELKKKQK